MSQNEEENVLTSTNSTNSTASESLSSEMWALDPQELWSFGRMHPGQRLSPSTIMMLLPVCDDPQLEPNQQPMPPSHQAVHTNNYRRQLQPMPPMMIANGGIPSTSPPWIGSIVPHNPSFLHRECYSFNPNAYYNSASSALQQQQRLGVEQMQFEDPRLQGTQSVQQLQFPADRIHTLVRRPGLPSLQQQQRGVEQNMQLVEPRVQASWALQQEQKLRGVERMQFADPRLQGTKSVEQQQRRGVEQNMQLVEPRVQASWALQQEQQLRGVERIQFVDPRLRGTQSVQQLQFPADRIHTLVRQPGLPSLQQQQRGVEQNMQLVEPRVQASWALQQEQQLRGVERIQFEDPRLQGTQSVQQQQQRRGVEQSMQLVEPRVQASWAQQQEQQRRGVERMLFEDPRLQGTQSVQQQQQQQRRSAEQNMQLVEPRVQVSWAQQQEQQRRVVERMQFEDPRLQGTQSVQQQRRVVEQNMQLMEPRVQASRAQQQEQQRRVVERMQFEDPRLQGTQSVQQQQQQQQRRSAEQNMQLVEPRVQVSWAQQQEQQRRVVERMQFEDPRLQGTQSVQQQRRVVEQNMQLMEPRVQVSWAQQQEQQRRVVERMQFEDPRLQGTQSVQQLQFPADRIHTLGRRQRPWTSFFQRPGNTAVGRTTAMECRQSNGTIRYCATCNALWPANGQPPATHGENDSCKLTALFPDKCVPMFECYQCNVRIRMDNIADHVATVCHDSVPDKDGHHYMSFFCDNCNRVFYAPLSMFVKHRQSLHSTGSLNPSVPSRLYVMYALMRDFVLNGRDIMLYACLTCMYMSPYSRNRGRSLSRCSVCAQPDNRFYCQYCNVVFYAPQAGYDMHRFTFEHFYLMYHRWARSNASVQPADAGNTGGGRGRGGGRRRGRAVGNGVASASEQS